VKRIAPPLLPLACAALLPATVGCLGRPSYRLLHVIGLAEKPLVVSLVLERSPDESNPPPLLNPFEPYGELFKALGQAAGSKVIGDLCFPFQLEPNLGLGICHLAIVSPLQYAQITHREPFEVLAVAADEKDRAARSALLVVAASSPIQTVEELRGRKVAFGPLADARTHHAGLMLLAEHGLSATDLSLELLPLPGSLKHFPHMRGVAQSVINGSSDAGLIDVAAWERFPESDARPDEPVRDKLRVLAATVPLPDALILRSPTLDDATAGKVRQFLLSAASTAPDALRPLHLGGYHAPTPELLDTCVRVGQMQPPTTQGAADAAAPQ